MKKCEGIYSLIGKVNHKSAIYGFQLLKEENIHPRQMPLIIHLKKCEGCTPSKKDIRSFQAVYIRIFR